jgi:hypothetical protein
MMPKGQFHEVCSSGNIMIQYHQECEEEISIFADDEDTDADDKYEAMRDDNA